MKFSLYYRASLYLMLVFSCLVLSVDSASTHPFYMLYPPAVAAAGMLAALTVDRRPEVGLGRDLANMLGLGSAVLAYIEYALEPQQLVMALGHWLVYLAMIKMFLPAKTDQDDWFLFILALIQVLIGGYISQSDRMGLLLAAWAVLALWTLGLSHLHREAERAAKAGGGERIKAVAPAREPYPGLFDRAFLFAAVRVAATTLALGGLIFLVMPRWEGKGVNQPGQAIAKHLTGFSEEVTIGQVGEILDNDSIVMSVTLYEGGSDAPVEPSGEPLWRGVALRSYDNGRWRRDNLATSIIDFANFPRPTGKTLRQVYELETSPGDTLFSLRPILSATSKNPNLLGVSPQDGTLFRTDLRTGTLSPSDVDAPRSTFRYEVTSLAGGGLTQPGEEYPRDRRVLLEVPAAIKEKLQSFAEPIVNRLSKAEREQPSLVARALESHLKDSGEFTYTLNMERKDANADPVVDFLFNRKEGHCAYYASALVLLLRSQDIPARFVNGFKGGDWNSLSQLTTVRQKHAHSWVEALVSKDSPDWMTLDPTPGAERRQVVETVGGGNRGLRTLSDYIRHVWTFYIVGYNADRQKNLIYDPARQLADLAMQGYRQMGQALRSLVAWLVRFRDLRAFFSVKGFFVSTCLMLVVVGLLRLAYWVLRKLLGRLVGAGGESLGMASGVAVYNRLVRLLSEAGLERTPAETPREFARRASVLLAARGDDSEGLETVPNRVVEAFYGIRFGAEDLPPPMLQELESGLDTLENTLRPRPS